MGEGQWRADRSSALRCGHSSRAGVGFVGEGTASFHAKYVGFAALDAFGAALAVTFPSGLLSRLAPSQSVGSSRRFLTSGPLGPLFLQARLETGNPYISLGTHRTYGNFKLGTTGFVGIRLGNGDYGWIRLRLDDTGLNQPFTTNHGGLGPFGDGENYPEKLTIIDWADDDSGAPIQLQVPGGTAPEPSSLALLAAGALGLAAFRRRKQGKSSLKTRT